jgi:hypothetical protein
MALGGSAVKKAPVQLYGIPQENMGTSSQMGFGKKGGTINANKKINAMNKVNKMQVGGMSTTPKMSTTSKKPVVKKTVAPKKTTVSRKIIDSYIPMGGPDRLLKKPTMAKKGGTVNKMQAGGTSSTKTNMFGKTKNVSEKEAMEKVTKYANKPGSTVKSTTNGTEKTYVTKPRANSNRSVTTTFKKVGGAVKKPLVKAQTGKTVKSKTPFQNYMKTPGAVASDTTQTFSGIREGSNPKLDKAYYDTYYAGQENKRRTGIDKVKYDAKGNRLGTGYKKVGGVVKSKKK